MNIPRKPQDVQMDLTAALAELAALREELANEKSENQHLRNRIDQLIDDKHTLTADLLACGTRRKAAEQRNAKLIDLLEHAYGAIDENDGWKQLCQRILAVIQPDSIGLEKPTESGASEPATFLGFNVIEDETMAPNEVRLCNCNQGRLPCTCKTFVADGQARDA